MRYHTQTVRIGERVGDIDWSYDFRSHFDCYACSDEQRDAICKSSVEQLKAIETGMQSGKKVLITDYGGWPRLGWREVLLVGMYDGWPYWKPVPSVMTSSPIGGGEWKAFCAITGYRVNEWVDQCLPPPTNKE